MKKPEGVQVMPENETAEQWATLMQSAIFGDLRPHEALIAELSRVKARADAADAMRAALQMVLFRWTFDERQQHAHTWHDMQDCATVIHKALSQTGGQK
jgi:hypothetical protein